MTSGTIIVLHILAAFVLGSVVSMIRAKRAGKSLQCGGNCENCSMNCKQRVKENTKQD